MAASNRVRSRQQSGKMAFCGLMVGLSAALMLAGGLIPVATYCAPIYGGILLLPILIEYGKKSAFTAYAATTLISLMLSADKEAAFFYLFIGCYPILKPSIDKLASRPLRILIKLLFFNVSILVMYALLAFVLGMRAVTSEFSQMGMLTLEVFIVAMNACMMLYDRLLISISLLYVRKLRPRLRFLRR